MARWLCILAALLIAAFAGNPRVSIRVYPHIVSEGSAVRIVCYVRREPEHRNLRIGISEYRMSDVQLEGELAPIQHTFLVEHVPCDVGEPFCLVEDSTKKVLARVAASMEIAGCG
jgi:hypothetical protein